MKEFFITFEGIEGCGKSTQLHLLKNFLEQKGYKVVATREPGGTALGEEIRRILLDPHNTHIDIKTELLLYEAARAQHVEEVIKPALDGGAIVLCDRFTDATLAYQGFAQGISHTLIEDLNRFATGNLSPDFTILIDLPPEIGLSRALKRQHHTNRGESESRLEKKDIAFHQMVRLAYLQIAERNGKRFFIADGRENPEQLHTAIRTSVLSRMEG